MGDQCGARRQTQGRIQPVAALLLFMGSCAWIRRFLARLTASWPEIGARLGGVEIGVDYKSANRTQTSSICALAQVFSTGD